MTGMVRAVRPLSHAYDAVIVGGGHNGLVAAAYVARQGTKICLFICQTKFFPKKPKKEQQKLTIIIMS